MPPEPLRGEVWQIDFGLAAKVRPALVLSQPPSEAARALVTVVYHTTAVRGSPHEVPMKVRGLEDGAFDAQSIYTVPLAKLIRHRATLTAEQLAQVERAVRAWLVLR